MPATRRRAPHALAAVMTLAVLLVSAGPGHAVNVVHGVALTPSSPAALMHETHVEITFEYETDEPGGALVWFRPITEGGLSPEYGAHGSPLYHGTGSGDGYFTILSGETLVDHVRVQMWNADQSALLFEDVFPVQYHYAASGEITNIQLAPQSPAFLQLEAPVDITFDYTTSEQDGVMIFFRPLTGGELTPDYGAHGSPVYPAGMGVGDGWFTILAGETAVDEVRVRMTDASQTIVFHEFRFPVEYYFQATSTEVETWGGVKARFR